MHGVAFSAKRQDCDGQSGVELFVEGHVRKAKRGDTIEEGKGKDILTRQDMYGSVREAGPSLHCGFCGS